MERFLARCAVALALVVCPTVMRAGDVRQVIPTRCEESEVALDAEHTASLLGPCSDSAQTDVLWHLDRIDQVGGGLDGHYLRRSTGAGVVVYVMDTGVMASHDEFVRGDGSKVIAGYDVTGSVPIGASACVSGNKATAPCFSDWNELVAASHGTSVASLIAGRNVGVAPDASIVSVRVMNERGLATTHSYLEGLDVIVRHAWSLDPRPTTSVVNISGWVLDRIAGMPSSSVVPYATVERKIADMIAGVDANGRRDPKGKKFLFVVAANNIDGGCGRSGFVDRFPAVLGATLQGMITVGGMTEANSGWGGSCRGGVEVLAPADGIFSATITAKDHYRGHKPNLRSGTSFAVPIISGIAALLIADHPDATPAQLERWITSTPSRVLNPDAGLADGKVAYSEGLPPAYAVRQTAPWTILDFGF